MALEQVGYDGPEGSVQRGQHQELILGGTSKVLVASDSGALCVFDTVATLFTLPVPVAGMYFDFTVTLKTTSEHKLLTSSGTFLKGFLGSRTTTAIAGTDGFVANGTTHVSVSMDGGATGGDAGGWMRVVAISATVWAITGDNYCGTTVGTDPFDTT